MDAAKDGGSAFRRIPKAHWQKICSTNPLERVDNELKRRSRVVGIFSNVAAAIRSVNAFLTNVYDEWQAPTRRYLSEESMAQLNEHVRRVVVLVDDLDRCLLGTIVETLETMRLFLFVRKMAFVIAADENCVADALRDRYPAGDQSVEEAD